MAKSSEERIAGRLLDQIGNLGFEPSRFAYYITRAGYNYQFILWKLVRHLMENWAVDYESGVDKGSTDYLRQTIHARQILDLMEKQDRTRTRTRRR